MVNISVICPTYNSSKFIKKTIQSIVEQDKLVDEIIFSDDGSDDKTVAIIDSLMSKYKHINYKLIKNIHKGPGAARNIAIKYAKHEWVAFIDSDDIWKKNKISIIKELMKHNKNINFFCHNEILVDTKNNKKPLDYYSKYKQDKLLTNQVYVSNKFSTSAVVCKKSLFEKYGFFNEDLLSAQDHELWIRLSENLKVFFINEYLGYYVQREGNITSGNLWKKFINEIKIAYMHRRLVSFHLFYLRLIRILAMYIKFVLQRFFFNKVV